MRTLLRITNILLLAGMVGCCLGAIAGMIVLLPFVAGAWALNLVGLLGLEEAARAKGSEDTRAAATGGESYEAPAVWLPSAATLANLELVSDLARSGSSGRDSRSPLGTDPVRDRGAEAHASGSARPAGANGPRDSELRRDPQ